MSGLFYSLGEKIVCYEKLRAFVLNHRILFNILIRRCNVSLPIYCAIAAFLMVARIPFRLCFLSALDSLPQVYRNEICFIFHLRTYLFSF